MSVLAWQSDTTATLTFSAGERKPSDPERYARACCRQYGLEPHQVTSHDGAIVVVLRRIIGGPTP